MCKFFLHTVRLAVEIELRFAAFACARGCVRIGCAHCAGGAVNERIYVRWASISDTREGTELRCSVGDSFRLYTMRRIARSHMPQGCRCRVSAGIFFFTKRELLPRSTVKSTQREREREKPRKTPTNADRVINSARIARAAF